MGRLFKYHSNDDGESVSSVSEEKREPSFENQVKRASAGKVSADMPSSVTTLLRDISEQLRKNETERRELLKKIARYEAQIDELEVRADNSEKAYLTLEHQLGQADKSFEKLIDQHGALEKDYSEQNERFEEIYKNWDKFGERIDGVLTHQAKINDSLANNAAETERVNRRLDKITQDRSRFARKIERLEDMVSEARETLQAKALVLLTDQSMVRATTPALGAPTRELDEEEEKLTEENAAYLSAGQDKGWWQRSLPSSATIMVGLVILTFALGWWVNELRLGSNLPTVAETSTDNSNTVQDLAIDEGEFISPEGLLNAEKSQLQSDAGSSIIRVEPLEEPLSERALSLLDEDLNAIEPGTPNPTQMAAATIPPKPVNKRPLNERITEDSSLPPLIKHVETQAFDGISEAQHDLAAIYTAGHGGVKQNYVRAAQWFEEAADNGVANAQYNLGVLFHQGLGVSTDIDKAIHWYEAAAAQDHPEAQYNLGIAHIEGIGIDYNPQKAAEYFENAASSGITEAAYNLGLIYENGLLGETKPNEALLWYKHAADNGSTEAKTAMTELAKKLDVDLGQVNELVSRMKQGEDVSTQSASQAPKATVKQTSVTSGPNIADQALLVQIQEQLMQMGLYPGPADGIWGQHTEAAIKSYQSFHNLSIDGKPSEVLLSHMLMQSNAENRFTNVETTAAFAEEFNR